jgi:hypothetical protein
MLKKLYNGENFMLKTKDELKDDLKNVSQKIKESNSKPIEQVPTTFCRVCAYFIIYSIFGFLIETIFAFVNYGVLESRQGFLYGPFCCIYGVRSGRYNFNFKKKIF